RGPAGAMSDSAPLVYPCGDPPAPGTAKQVAEGLWWARMPLPVRLNHINIWLIDEGGGWTVVDTGMLCDEAVKAWAELFQGLLRGRPVQRVIATHMHPDHVGMAGWLTRKFDCRLWMTRLEYLSCRVIASDTQREPPPDALRFYRRAGWSEAALEAYKGRFGIF